MRKPEQIRFDLQSNQNLSRRNIQKAYGLGNISETTLGPNHTLREKFYMSINMLQESLCAGL